MPADSFDTRATGLLATMAADVSKTLVDAPRSTIIPHGLKTTGGARAMALLAELSSTGKLAIGAILGEGGMGVVRAAEQVALGRTVAVKTLKSRKDPAAAVDLLREAWVTGSLEHPNIVPIHYIELDDAGMPVIVLKRISGAEWSSLYNEPAAVEQRFGKTDLLAWNLDILLDVLNALRFAHSRHIVHRDLKPSNVMIGDFGEVYLLDWGIAVSTVDDGSGRMALASDATEAAGTPCYMAPEMLGGERPITERTDVYLAGAVLFEIMAGRPPHEGKTAVEVITQVILSRPKLPDDAPPELAQICLRAMAADPNDRYPSVDALRVAITKYLEHRGSAALAVRAQEQTDQLLGLLAHPERDHEAIYRLFGACRFGFHEALAVWPDNADAKAGVARATCAMAEYELAAGSPDAAVGLLRDLANAPAALVARAKKAADEAAQHKLDLERLEKLHDAKTGTRTRAFLTGGLGLSFTVLPLCVQLAPNRLEFESHRGNILWALGSLVVLLGVIFWARDSMRATLFNRRLAAAGVWVFVGQIILTSGCWALGLSVPQAQVIMIFLWTTISVLLAITIDRWLVPCAVIYVACFLVAARYPGYRYFAMAAGNFAFGLNAVIRWAPGSLKQTAEEKAFVEEAKRKRLANRVRR